MKRLSVSGDVIRFEVFWDAVYNPIIAIDTGGKIFFCNHALAKMARMEVDAILGARIDEVFEHSQLKRIIRTGKTESARRLKVGHKVYMTNRTPIRKDGRIVGAVAVLQDISELEAISSELAHTRQIVLELDAIIESSFDGIYVCDGTGRTIRVNRAYERITGICGKDVCGRNMKSLVNDGFFNESVTLRVLESRKPESLIQKIKTGKTVMVTGNPFFDDKGEISLVITNVRDVTELYRLQSDLERVQNLRARYEKELEKFRGTCGEDTGIVIRSKKMQEIYGLAVRLAQVSTTVLVQGESGVGKEVLVDLIHTRSPRKDKPLVKISCAAIPEHLLESELFGYAPGAFTGASRGGKAGLFETAHEGTLFLDEIGELPKGLQAKLLRALQEQEIIRVGSNETIPVDVRIIAATNRDLQKMSETGKFRKDLYFRLRVVPVVIPPLRDRQEDIIPLAYHFLDKYNDKYNFSKQFDAQVLNALDEYDWPGNVRELENTVERLVVITPTDIITLNDIPKKFYSGTTSVLPLKSGSLKATLDEMECRILKQALQTHKSTRKVGRALGIDQSTVVRKLKRHGIRT